MVKPIEIHTKRIVMGDIFENIQNSTIINKSLVENAFNKIKKDVDEDTSKVLLKIAQHIDESNDPSAGILFNNFTEELNKPQADKSKLKSFWSALEKVLPTVNEISEVASKIIPLFT